MKSAFFKITEDKQNKIYQAAVAEFAQNGFDLASLNQIIKEAGISKGGMFKYINSKEDLYLHILRDILSGLTKHQLNRLEFVDACYISRIRQSVVSGLEFYNDKPNAYALVLGAFADVQSSLYEKVMILRHEVASEYDSKLMEGVDWSLYNMDKGLIIRLIQIILEGLNALVLKQNMEILKVEDFEASLMSDFDLAMKSITTGIVR